jgi:hypothetical protein
MIKVVDALKLETALRERRTDAGQRRGREVGNQSAHTQGSGGVGVGNSSQHRARSVSRRRQAALSKNEAYLIELLNA